MISMSLSSNIQSYKSCGNKTYSLAHGINLRSMTTTGDLDTNIDVGELIVADDENGLVELSPEDLGGEELDGLAVDLDQAPALHSASDGCDDISTATFRIV